MIVIMMTLFMILIIITIRIIMIINMIAMNMMIIMIAMIIAAPGSRSGLVKGTSLFRGE